MISEQNLLFKTLLIHKNENGAKQKENIFCRIFANLKSLIFMSSFFAPLVSTQREAA